MPETQAALVAQNRRFSLGRNCPTCSMCEDTRHCPMCWEASGEFPSPFAAPCGTCGDTGRCPDCTLISARDRTIAERRAHLFETGELLEL